MANKGHSNNFSLAVGVVMRELKRMAIKHGIVMFLVVHMKKKFKDEAPDLDDLRDSSFVEQEADIVLLLTRGQTKDTDNYVGKKILTNEVAIAVEKNRRTGKMGSVKLIRIR